MFKDKFGQPVLSCEDLFNAIMEDPGRELHTVLVDMHLSWPRELELNNAPKVAYWKDQNMSVREWDAHNQQIWWMPTEYQNYPIVEWVLGQCGDDSEKLERAGIELIEFENRNCLSLLRYLKYLVDTMRHNGIVWGVGRGSSVASYVLYLIGVHRIDSLKYELPVSEFFK